MTGRRFETGAGPVACLAAGLAAGLAACLAAAVLPVRAQEQLRDVTPPESRPPAAASAPKTMPETLADAIGTWDLSLDGSNRRCELSLSGDSGPNGRTLRFPAGCRRALPALGKAAGWLFTGRNIRIVDADIRPLLEFAPRPDGHSMQGQAERGESYSLVPLQTLAMLPAQDPQDLKPEPLAGPPPAGRTADHPETHAIPGSQPVLPADVLVRPEPPQDRGHPDERVAAIGAGKGKNADARPTAPSSGVYALDRFSDKDVCRIALDPRPASLSAVKDASRDPSQALAPVRILPGCRDSGIATFDPVSWRFASGHLTLKAKRGHAVNLVVTGDGSWRRDPDVGTTFVLRKVE